MIITIILHLRIQINTRTLNLATSTTKILLCILSLSFSRNKVVDLGCSDCLITIYVEAVQSTIVQSPGCATDATILYNLAFLSLFCLDPCSVHTLVDILLLLYTMPSSKCYVSFRNTKQLRGHKPVDVEQVSCPICHSYCRNDWVLTTRLSMDSLWEHRSILSQGWPTTRYARELRHSLSSCQ